MTFYPSSENAGQRLSFYLKNSCRLSRGLITKLKNCSGILVNQKSVFTSYILKQGDVVEIKLPPDLPHNIEPADIPLEILFEDEFILAVNKPENMEAHPSARKDKFTLANALAAYLGTSVRMLGRLDRGTSGVVLVSKNQYVHSLLSDNIHKIQKTYYAVVCGNPPCKGVIRFPIARKAGSVLMREASPFGKPAYTEYRKLAFSQNFSLLEVKIKTGRTHQIRVHFAHIGYPLLGDWLYGAEDENVCRPMLHAGELAFYHPITNQHMVIKAPLPISFF